MNAIGVSSWIWLSPFNDADAPSLVARAREAGADLLEVAVEQVDLVSAPALREALEGNSIGLSICGAFGPDRDLANEESRVRGAALASEVLQ
jgi:D-psicose/D-tagatose/L-ribulose 3-epimerase